MKRSKKVTLLLMAPLASLILTGCAEQPVDALVFNNPDECASASSLSPEQCKADYEQAKKVSATVAPKYADKSACEADFGVGKCETAPATQQQSSGSGFFMPMMMGYMMGKMFNSGGVGGGNMRGNFAPEPLYKSRDDSSTFRTANNAPVSRNTGLVSVKPSMTRTQATSSVTRRGGFGAQAAARSSMTGG